MSARPGARGRAGLMAAALLLAAGCGREEPPAGAPLPLPISVLADTGRGRALEVRPPPEARAWVARVTPARPGEADPPLPDAPPDTTIPDPPPPGLEIDEGLRPPILREPARLVPPAVAGAPRRGPRSVVLDVRVDEDGRVTDVRWAGGGVDRALVEAAVECARGMRFHPALLGGRPVAVWCRQRFDFGAH